jgi:hypothetical protein
LLGDGQATQVARGQKDVRLQNSAVRLEGIAPAVLELQVWVGVSGHSSRYPPKRLGEIQSRSGARAGNSNPDRLVPKPTAIPSGCDSK